MLWQRSFLAANHANHVSAVFAVVPWLASNLSLACFLMSQHAPKAVLAPKACWLTLAARMCCISRR
jgi:hypothetical protein